jgi:pilus assembly protein CpaF
MEGDIITLQDLFLFDFGAGIEEGTGKYLGRLKATGIRPTFSEHLQDIGIRLPADLFDPEPFARRQDNFAVR